MWAEISKADEPHGDVNIRHWRTEPESANNVCVQERHFLEYASTFASPYLYMHEMHLKDHIFTCNKILIYQNMNVDDEQIRGVQRSTVLKDLKFHNHQH